MAAVDKCPSCAGEIQALKEHKFFCPACDAIFQITREGPRVETPAPLDDLRERVGKLEDQIGAEHHPSPSPDPRPDPDGDPGGDPDEDPDGDPDEDDEIFPP